MNQVSPIRPSTNNDISVNSTTTGGFNFRKLKPNDESQSEFTDPAITVDKVIGEMGEATSQGPLCFDNSPLRSNGQQRLAGRIVKKTALSPNIDRS